MSDLAKRSVTAVFFAAIMIGGICWNVQSFVILFGVINAICIWEYSALALSVANKDQNKNFQNSVMLVITGSLIYFLFNSEHFKVDMRRTYALLLVIPFILVSLQVIKKKGHSFLQICVLLFGLIYITVPFVLLSQLFFHNPIISEGFKNISDHSALSILLLIWTHDTFAYLTGRILGKHPLHKFLSPKKTWEGFFGGMAFTIALALIFYNNHFLPGNSMDAIAIAIIISSFGTIGDLFESLLKRIAGVKDSGSILPGHGGLMDRFDAFIFVIPFLTAYYLFRLI